MGDKMNICENVKVPFTLENIKKCKCPQCPVQTNSKCAIEKLNTFAKGIESAREEDFLKNQDVPGIYCSIGRDTCQDFFPEKQCMLYLRCLERA